MATFIFLLLLSIFANFATAQSQSNDSGFISAVISEKGLNFVKDLLIEQELRALVPLKLPDIEKSIRIPIVGVVHVSIANITFSEVSVSSSTVHAGDTGIVIVASGATANLSMGWRYSYSTWLVPIEISDEGIALVQVEGMEVGLTVGMKNRNGTLELTVMECGCYMQDLSITLHGGASWFYQGFVNAFVDEIRSAVEKAITKKITEGTSKLDSLLRTLPKKIDVDDNVALNVTFVNDPVLGDSFIKFDINGLFIPSDKASLLRYSSKNLLTSVYYLGASKMLGISLDETVFNSASLVYFQARSMHWLVDKVPDQSLLNTASWKFIIPRLYRKYPNDDMELNITLISPPIIWIKPEGIGATITADMTVNVLDASDHIPVACITVVVAVSGVVEISGNNLAGKAELNDFTLNLKWSKVGNFHMSLIQGGHPTYVATRGLYSLTPPTIFVPPCIKSDIEKLFEIHRSMSRDELKFDLVALDVGETYEIQNDLVVRPFRTHHVIPSQGYVIYSVRKKLKKQYAHLKGPQIKKLKDSGVEITDTILSPEVAFTGDTMSDFILESRNADALRAKVLITEATFLDEECDIEQTRERGHMHLFEDICQAVSKLQKRVSAKVVALTEGFRSSYS